MTFWTRTETMPIAGDNLEVRMSTDGGSSNVGATTTNVGNFNILLTSIASGAYPQDWTQFNATITGLAGPTNVRLAFRYLVTDISANGDIIDSVNVFSNAPEPSTALFFGAGLAVVTLGRRYTRRA